jgi:hypothetical protein
MVREEDPVDLEPSLFNFLANEAIQPNVDSFAAD